MLPSDAGLIYALLDPPLGLAGYKGCMTDWGFMYLWQLGINQD